MKLKKSDYIYMGLIVVVAVAIQYSLICCALYISPSNISIYLFYISIILVLLITIAVPILLIRRIVKRTKQDTARISSFLARAAAGYLQDRIEINDKDSFATICKDLNIMMENLEEMSQAKADFLSNMSHEIRTPMSAIIGMAQIASNTDDIERIRDCLSKIEDNSEHLIGVINDILDFSKMDAGKLELDEQIFSLKKDMDFIVTMFGPKTAEKNLSLVLSMDNVKHDAIVTDSLRLNQVIINFLSNAVKFTDPGGEIRIDISEMMHMNGDGVYSFAVSDTGIGIEPEHANKLFSAYAQATAGTTKKYGGTGLGLAISKNIVEKMGGEIELQSVPGEGSTFSFTIKVRAEEALKEEDLPGEEGHALDLSGKRLLIVDDIEINRVIAVEILKSTRAEMETAVNGKEAFEMFEQSTPGYYDMILMDMQMPVMDGCASSEAIRASVHPDAKTIKIVAVTANVMRDDIKRSLDAGMNAHIGKPIDLEEANKVISSLIQGEQNK
jgi:signal transduction histidine kinase/CheY-like chemotaxis protein